MTMYIIRTANDVWRLRSEDEALKQRRLLREHGIKFSLEIVTVEEEAAQ